MGTKFVDTPVLSCYSFYHTCIKYMYFTWNSNHEKLLLVGGWATPLKNMKVNWDDYSQYTGK